MVAIAKNRLIALGLALAGAAVLAVVLVKRFTREPTQEERCRDGQLELCFALGLKHQHGLKAKKDRAHAASLFDFACDKGHGESCASSGQLLGSAGKHDLARAKFERACTLGSKRGCHRLATLLSKGEGGPKDEARAATLETRACAEAEPPKKRHAEACHELAKSYEAGRGVPADPSRALALFRAACDADPPAAEACGELGARNLFGRGVPPNADAARGLLERACKEKHAASCFELGRMFLEGTGVARDPAKAEELFDTACARGDKRGCDIRAGRE